MYTLTEWVAQRYEVLSTPGMGVGLICNEPHEENIEHKDLTYQNFHPDYNLKQLLDLIKSHEEVYHGQT